MQVTIALLPVSLSLVHVPRSRIHALAHPILRQILQPKPIFLNITCNEVELCLFADQTLLADFEPIARSDRHSQHGAGSVSRSKHNEVLQRFNVNSVEVSYEKWSVLQVESHNDQIDNSGARVNEVSAPLASAGISILYQSSYMSDFILVKETKLQETMHLLAEAGFEVYSSESEAPPINPIGRTGNIPIVDDFHFSKTSPSHTRSATDLTGLGFHENSIKETIPLDGRNPSQETSTSTGDVQLLPSDLVCVGLSEELGADHWGLKLVKLMAFPEMIPSVTAMLQVSRLSTAPSAPLYPTTKLRTSLPNLFPVHNPTSGPSSPGILSDPDSYPLTDSDDEHLSHSPKTKTSISTTSLPTPGFRSQADSKEAPRTHRSKEIIQPLLPILALSTDSTLTTTQDLDIRIPFFSYTRTVEGSSLTTDVYILSALFPPHERHMIIRSGEIDSADKRLVKGQLLNSQTNEEDTEVPSTGILNCLQIDLQSFGLDKHGLVNRFSKVLEENCINHMYNSSFKSANLLVEKKDASRAQALLNDTVPFFGYASHLES